MPPLFDISMDDTPRLKFVVPRVLVTVIVSVPVDVTAIKQVDWLTETPSAVSVHDGDGTL
jgi:hypothetical protein